MHLPAAGHRARAGGSEPGGHARGSADDLESLRAAAFLHDVGHMTLSGGDGFEVPGHAEQGEKIVSGAQFPADVVAAVRHHHDRWDATGDRVPVLARILALTERYEALTAGRGFARVDATSAMAAVSEGAGTEFDPAAVDALGRAVQDGSLELDLPDLALPAVARPTEILPRVVRPGNLSTEAG